MVKKEGKELNRFGFNNLPPGDFELVINIYKRDDIACYIALDKPKAAARFVGKIFDSIDRLADHPLSGKQVEELPGSPYREIVVPPCRVFYRPDKECCLYPSWYERRTTTSGFLTRRKK